MIYCMSNIGVGITMMSFGTTAATVSKLYEIDQIYVQLCALSFLLMFVPGNFLSLFVLQKYGFKICVSVLQCIL